jgi:DNA transposition AAA+ family ATPase
MEGKKQRIKPYELDILNDQEFKKIVQIWERDILQLPEPSNLAKAENLKLLKKATSLLIGRLDMILRKVAIRALSQGDKCITSEILKQVINTTKWSYEKKRKRR